MERVIDGDTIFVTTPEGRVERVRLIGIDTPESQLNGKAKRDSGRTGQDVETITKMGQEATEFVKSSKRIGELLKEGQYQLIEIHQENGKVVSIAKTTKRKF